MFLQRVQPIFNEVKGKMRNKMKNIAKVWRSSTAFLLSAFSFLILITSCSNELDEALQPAGNGNLQFVVGDFPAFGESPDTRVIGTQDVGKTAWENGDQIIVTLTSKKFGAQSAALTYNGTSWSTAVSFLYLDNETPAVSAIYAPCYEVTEDGVMKLSDGMQLGMTEYIPADCSIANGSISINFTGVKRTYSRLRIAADAGQKLAVTTTGFTPAGATKVATEPYTITADKKGNAYLYGVFAKGATVSVCNGNVEMESHTFTNATEERVSYALDVPWPYLTFTADAEQTMTINTYGGYVLNESMQYSVNGGEWAQLTAWKAITFGGDNGTLRLRGKSANGTATSSSSRAQISFGDDNVQVACSGDIRTLVDYENYATVSTANARFCFLFYGSTNLISAPELPATTLADNCYRSMFYNCTNLTTAPELPATTLADNCYRSMFYNCTNLTTAPELPATTLANECYLSMFYNCTNLTTAPELPATTLTKYCYYEMFKGCTSLTAAPELHATTLAEYCCANMFYGCTSLTTAPELPATTLADRCYYYMFSDCTSLTAAPELPARTLTGYCYYYMFKGCTSLTVAPELPATTLADNCYRSMFYDCTNLTTAPELPAATLADRCYYYMFKGCTSLTAAPELHATTLAEYCCANMFYGCTSLTTAPELPATTLVDYCYYEMFRDCTNLTTAPKLPATTLAESCYKSMFQKCSELTKAPKLPATTLAESCYKSMFRNCPKLEMAPELPATMLVNCCYQEMFSGCTNLSSITMLATNISATYCLTDWVSGVASSGTFTKAAAMTSLPTGTSGIPGGWTVVNK